MKNAKNLEKNSKTIAPDLRKALSAAPKARGVWENLTPVAQRDFVRWVETAKQPETRRRRIERTCSMLALGKRRPCCYSPVPMGLYSLLRDHRRAKAQWSDLTPDERRDFVDWIDSAKDSATQKDRIKKVYELLEAGKRRP